MKAAFLLLFAFTISNCSLNQRIEKKEQKIDNKLATVFFDLDSSSLDSIDKEIIKQNATIISKKKDYDFIIKGHSDPTGPEHYNKALAMKRAQVVKSELLKNGVSPEKLKVEVLGESEPIVSAQNTEHFGANRRVEIESKKTVSINTKERILDRAAIKN